MIRSWRNAASRKLWDGAKPNRFAGLDFEKARGLSANRLALELGVPSGRITDILNGRRGLRPYIILLK